MYVLFLYLFQYCFCFVLFCFPLQYQLLISGEFHPLVWQIVPEHFVIRILSKVHCCLRAIYSGTPLKWHLNRKWSKTIKKKQAKCTAWILRVDLSWAAWLGGVPQCDVFLHRFQWTVVVAKLFQFLCFKKHLLWESAYWYIVFIWIWKVWFSGFFSSSGVHADVDIGYWWQHPELQIILILSSSFHVQELGIFNSSTRQF